MKIPKTLLATLGSFALLFGALSHNAQAIPINGSIGFDGSGMGMVTGPISTLSFNNPMTVGARTVDYTNVLGAQNVNFAPISWTGSGLSAVLTSVNSPEWTFTNNGTTYTFNLLSLTNASISGGFVTLAGTGTSFITGAINRDPTFATFSVQGTGTSFNFTIIQASNTSAAPDGGSALALLGIGVMGLEVLRRKVRPA